MFYTYVLKGDKDGELYSGSTSNLRRRVQEHNHGRVESTKSRKPFELVYYEAYLAESDARRRESQLKLRGQARRHLLDRIKDSIVAQSQS